MAQELAKRMRACARGSAPGTPDVGGRIIGITCMAGFKVLPQIGICCMSKAAVARMTMAVEWRKYRINVNAICPGCIDTETKHHHRQAEPVQRRIQMLPRKRVGQPSDLDAVRVMLASNMSSTVR